MTSVPLRLATFAAALVVAGLLGAGLGAAIGPVDVGVEHDEAPPATRPVDGHTEPTAPGSTHTGPGGGTHG